MSSLLLNPALTRSGAKCINLCACDIPPIGVEDFTKWTLSNEILDGAAERPDNRWEWKSLMRFGMKPPGTT